MKHRFVALTDNLNARDRIGQRRGSVPAHPAHAGNADRIDCAEQRLLPRPRRKRQLDQLRPPARLCDRNFERLHGWRCCRPPEAPRGRPIFTWTDRFAFAPSFQGGYFQRFGASDWLWGAKLSYNYLGATSTNYNSIIPQFGTYTTIRNPTPVPFSGPAYVRAAETSVLQEIDLIPFLGRAFGQSYVYAGGGPTLSQTRTRLNGLVGFALVDGGIVDQSGAPQDFSSSSWLFGGAAVVGVTYFLTPSWFLDLNYTYAATAGPHREIREPVCRYEFDKRGNIGRQFRLEGGDAARGPHDQQGFLIRPASL